MLQPNLLRKWIGDLRFAFAMLTRLPVSPTAASSDDIDPRGAIWAFPLVGLCLGIISASVYTLCLAAAMPPILAVIFGLMVSVLVTGGFHEDGLADFFDGMGGGTPQRRLEIMRDSHIGTFGTLALAFALMIKTASLAAIADPARLAQAWILSTVLSRAWVILLPLLLNPARPDGLCTAFAPLQKPLCIITIALGLGMAVGVWPGAAIPLALVAGAAFLALAWLANRLLKGYTGDVMGAGIAISEVAVLAAAATF